MQAFPPQTQYAWHPAVNGWVPVSVPNANPYFAPGPWYAPGGDPAAHWQGFAPAANPPHLNPRENPTVVQNFHGSHLNHAETHIVDPKNWTWYSADAPPHSPHVSTDNSRGRSASRDNIYRGPRPRGRGDDSDVTDDGAIPIISTPIWHESGRSRGTNQRISAQRTGRSHIPVGPQEIPLFYPPPPALNPLLTSKKVDWELRNDWTTARHHTYPNTEGRGIPFNHTSGIPCGIKIITIGFAGSKYQWLNQHWGSIIVISQDGDIKLGEIFWAISRYFNEELEETDLAELVTTTEMKNAVEKVWQERNFLDVDKRQFIDTQSNVCRRIDLLGAIKFYRLKIKWVGRDQCHLALSFSS